MKAKVLTSERAKLLKFGIVGLGGTFIDLLALALFKGLGLPTLAANTISYSLGIINNYIWNRRWTFKEAGDEPWLLQFLRFSAISLMGLALNNLIVAFAEFSLIGFGLKESIAFLPAKIIATAVVFIWNYTANRLWTFNDYNQEYSS